MRPLLFVGVLIALSLAGCERNAAPAGGSPKIYRHALDGAPGSLDPARADNDYAAVVVRGIFDTLYRYRYLSRPHELVPNLAADFPEVSVDGLSMVIRLREDVYFADDPAFPGGRGRAVTAHDVVYSMARHFDPTTRSRGAWLWRDRIAGLEAGSVMDGELAAEVGLEALDEHTVRVRLERPFPQFTHTLTTAVSAIVPREAVDYYGPEFGINPVGSGPYRLISLDETRAVLEPNARFDRGAVDLAAEGYSDTIHGEYGLKAIDGRTYPFIDRLEIHFIAEPTVRWSSLMAADGVDGILVPQDRAGRLVGESGEIELPPDMARRFRGVRVPEAGFEYYGFNMANPAIGHHPDDERNRVNRELRCAMREAFDWEERNRTFFDGMGEVFPGVIPPLLASWDPSSAGHSTTHDPSGARRRLEENGWTEEALPKLTFGIEATLQQRQMFEQVRGWMQEVGIPSSHLEPKILPTFSEYLRAIANHELDIFLLGWTFTYPDAQYSLQLFYGPNAAPGANSFNYLNADYDSLYERASILPPGPERTALYRQMNQMVIDDCVIIGSLSRTRLHLWKRNVALFPDRDLGSGFFLHFVDLIEPES